MDCFLLVKPKLRSSRISGSGSPMDVQLRAIGGLTVSDCGASEEAGVEGEGGSLSQSSALVLVLILWSWSFGSD